MFHYTMPDKNKRNSKISQLISPFNAKLLHVTVIVLIKSYYDSRVAYMSIFAFHVHEQETRQSVNILEVFIQ